MSNMEKFIKKDCKNNCNSGFIEEGYLTKDSKLYKVIRCSKCNLRHFYEIIATFEVH